MEQKPHLGPLRWIKNGHTFFGFWHTTHPCYPKLNKFHASTFDEVFDCHNNHQTNKELEPPTSTNKKNCNVLHGVMIVCTFYIHKELCLKTSHKLHVHICDVLSMFVLLFWCSPIIGGCYKLWCYFCFVQYA